MGKVLEALELLEGLAALVANTTDRMRFVSTMVQQAHAEGRDLTDAEIAQVRNARADAMRRLRNLGD